MRSTVCPGADIRAVRSGKKFWRLSTLTLPPAETFRLSVVVSTSTNPEFVIETAVEPLILVPVSEVTLRRVPENVTTLPLISLATTSPPLVPVISTVPRPEGVSTEIEEVPTPLWLTATSPEVEVAFTEVASVAMSRLAPVTLTVLPTSPLLTGPPGVIT